MYFKYFNILNQFKKKNIFLLINQLIIDIAIIFINNYEKFFQKMKREFIFAKKFKRKIFKHLYQ